MVARVKSPKFGVPDEESPEWTDADFARAKPAREILGKAKASPIVRQNSEGANQLDSGYVRVGGASMATNAPTGDGRRQGAIRERSQIHNPKTDQWVKRDSNTGRFMDVKQDGAPFKGVTKEPSKRK
jgi:hypothetical protein